MRGARTILLAKCIRLSPVFEDKGQYSMTRDRRSDGQWRFRACEGSRTQTVIFPSPVGCLPAPTSNGGVGPAADVTPDGIGVGECSWVSARS